MRIQAKLIQFWIRLRSSFWFIPALMILMSVVLAASMVELDSRFGNHLANILPRLFQTNLDGARSILSSLASSMISVAGVTFSITIVALSLASAQYTSRVLRNFMRDHVNQVVLGVFVSIFVYCVIVLRTIHDGDGAFVPALSVGMGILLSIVGIGFLIFFIHHVASSIQASSIISRVGHETLSVIDALYPEKHAGEDEHSEEAEACVRNHNWTPIPAANTGYIQEVDAEGLMEWAESHQTIVRMLRGPGEFVIAGRPVLTIARQQAPMDQMAAELDFFIGVASYRTVDQDATFGIRQLVDISLKALSPGVNDTTTAVTSLNYLGAILERVSGRKIPGAIRRRNREVRLIARTWTHQHFVDEALSQIRQNARDNIAVHHAMLGAIESAFDVRMSPSRRQVFRDHLARIQRSAQEHVKDPDDLEGIQRHLRTVEQWLQTHDQ